MDSDDTRRRRSALACNTCRGRRTKCGGQRPQCSYCAEHGKECFYPEQQDPPPSPLRTELSKLWGQLSHITAIVQGQSQSPIALKKSSDHHPSLGFPYMTLQSTAFMKLLDLDPALPIYLEHLERRGRQPGVIHQPLPEGMIVAIDLDDASVLLHAFTEQIHPWYPVLHPEFGEDFLQAVTACFPASIPSCMTLLVLAIGCNVINRPDVTYIQAAMEMLPCVFADCSPRGVQCLLLFAIYHLCDARPCQAHDFVAMASYKLHTYIMNELDTDDNPRSIVGNCFWAALLIESEIRVQFSLVDSGIWNIIQFAPPLTTAATSWSYNPAYFVAEIAMRKMLQRCTWATSILAQNQFAYAPIVAAELERQLDEWLQLLPESLSFFIFVHGNGDYSKRQRLLSHESPQVKFLRTQYYAFKASVYWPAVYEFLTTGQKVTGDLLVPCVRFFASYVEFVSSAAAAVAVCRPNLWTLCTSVFTISMAALVAAAEPCLREVVPSGVHRSLELAVSVLDEVMEVSASLAEMGAILRERVRRDIEE
ncbi:hypothetical protein FE257_012526 [Aspergillus nanangensis]|uniref:Zn(2)-C6 fungal-type domain-containing protein n=1 Tax=Aspergillus nanangensis TaxID=2582783 RepID=A0AAD4CUT9_ASPNN|nr:hypothetical protein FE257_012526 [Aspergillus nanangensis]